MLAVAAGKADTTSKQRRRSQDPGKALANSRTLKRLELTPADAGGDARDKKIVGDQAGLNRQLVQHFIQSHARAPREFWLDLEALIITPTKTQLCAKT